MILTTLNEFDPFRNMENLDFLFLKIIVVCACCGWCYVEKLTVNHGYLDFLPKFYPKFIQKSLSCSYCAGGWFSIFTVLAFWQTFQYWTILLVIIAPCCTMALVGPIMHLNLFYNKYTNN